jgi:predicted nucleic-acid-binding protein
MKKVILLPTLSEENKLMQVLKPYIDKILQKASDNKDDVILFDIVQFTENVEFRREIILRVLDNLNAGCTVYTNLPRLYFDPMMNHVNQIKSLYDYGYDE